MFSHSDLQAFLYDISNFRLTLRSGVFPHDRGVKAFVKWFTGGRSRTSYLKSRLTWFATNIIWKDPFAIFCFDAVRNSGIDVVVTYRPPAAVAASYKRLNWTYDLSDVRSRLLETNWGGALMELTSRSSQSNISKSVLDAVLLWRSSTQMLLNSFEKGNPATIIRTGDLPDSCESILPALFETLDLKQTRKTRRYIANRFQAKVNQKSIPVGHPHTRRRDVGSVNTYWKEILNTDESEFVKRECSVLEALFHERHFPNAALTNA